MTNLNVVSDVFQRFKYKESSIRLKLNALEKRHTPENLISPCLNYEDTKNNNLNQNTMEVLERDNAASRNINFLKELNVAETQLRLMASFCPTDGYLQACKSKFMKFESCQ